MVQEKTCPHRGAVVVLGRRNRGRALRLRLPRVGPFEVDGKCVDMPREPARSATRSGLKSYPPRVRRLVWTYLGPMAETQ